MPETAPIEWPFPWAGLNSELNQFYLPPYALTICNNMYYTGADELRTRGGLTHRWTGVGATNVMYYWDYTDELYHAHGANLYREGVAVPGPAQTITDMVDFSTQTTPRLIVAEEEGGEGHTLHVWDGAAYNTLVPTSGGASWGRRLLRLYGRLFITRGAGNPSRIWYTDVLNPLEWNGAYGEGGFFDVAVGEGGDIVDWIYFRNALYIFKERAIYVMEGTQPVTFHVTKFEDTIGTVRGCIAYCPAGILYATDEGIFALGRGYGGEAHNLATPVRQALLTPLATAHAAYAVQPNTFIIVDGTTTTAYISNIANRPDVWSVWTLPVAMSAIYQGPRLYFGGAAGGIWSYEPDQNPTPGDTYRGQIQTGRWDMGVPTNIKNIRIGYGSLNAADNARVEFRVFIDGLFIPVETKTIDALDDPVTQIGDLNLNFDRCVGFGLNYLAQTGPCYFKGLGFEVVALGKRM